MTKCIVKGCDREIGSGGGRGLCSTHYKRMKRDLAIELADLQLQIEKIIQDKIKEY